ncbi:MAG: rRNA ((745)-N(1))-methyltransferase [Actinomycetota bacterium]|jgi:23S rRNA (guanine745-N1)-methyltransferase
MAEETKYSSVFACPHCALPLEVRDAGAVCLNGHSFDRAREGYLNLMVAGRVASSVTAGDTAESLAARRRFLNGGWYSPIVNALREALGTVEGPVLDVGCGEGYYLTQLDAPHKYGLDISKKAIQMASKSQPQSQFVVGTSFRLPVVDRSCASVFTVFAPHSFDEYNRVLQEGGTWVTVTPGPSHLVEMRPKRDEKILEREQRRAEPPAEANDAVRVQFTLELSDEAALDLYTMTPLQFQASSAEAVSHVREVSVDVWVSRSALTAHPK